MPEAGGSAFVGLWRAVGLVSAVECAVNIGLRRPLHVVGDYQIELAVAVVIYPGRAGGELVRPPHSRVPSQFRECAIAIVVKKMTLA